MSTNRGDPEGAKKADEPAEGVVEEPDARAQADPGGDPGLAGRIRGYEVLSLIGAGGMGEVYRARDTNLDREVALKVLPKAFAEDPERVSRFQREARLLAALNHPNIAAIYGLEESEGRHVLVLELVEGETLAERIARGPIPLAEALPFFRQMAAGLEAAHEKGIIHRDLKPANVTLTPRGQLKLLDFGLAKSFGGAIAAHSHLDTASPSDEQTAEGRILGTVAYMSPEQGRGLAVDKRTDVWAFGCVLYEALTGRRAFRGGTVSDTLAAVLEREVDWKTLPAGTPRPLRSLLRRCLHKDRERRLRDIGDARIEIEDVLAEPSSTDVVASGVPATVARGARWPRRVLEIGAAVALATAVVWFVTPWPPPARPVQRFSFTPENLENAAISPDGRKIAYTAGLYPKTNLWVQDLGQDQPRMIEGTEGARNPFWSPDGASIGFGVTWQLKKVPADGGTPVTLCELPEPRGREMFALGSWSPDNRSIVFQHGYPAVRLWEVPARGGRASLLFEPPEDQERLVFDGPHFLPLEAGPRVLLFDVDRERYLDANDPSSREKRWEIVLQDLDTNERRVLGHGEQPVYSPSGHVLFRRSQVVYALPFSLKTLQPTGDPFPVAENASKAYDGYRFLTSLSVAGDGTLVYIDEPRRLPRQLVRRDRSGRSLGTMGQPQAGMGQTRLSPDGRRAVVRGREREEDEPALWIHDVDPPLKSRFTFVPAGRPQWSPAGDRIAYSTYHGRESTDVLVKPVGGGAEPKVVVDTPDSDNIHDWSPDGRYILFNRQVRPEGRLPKPAGLWYRDINDASSSSEARLFLKEGILPRFSPDGRYVAYLSEETGLMEVYVQRFPEGGGKLQVSHGGATQMRWGRNGEIFYVKRVVVRGVGAGPGGTGTLVGVLMKTEPTLVMGVAQVLFESTGFAKASNTPAYDVSADGQWFVIPEVMGEAAPRAIRVVQNWAQELREQHPGSE